MWEKVGVVRNGPDLEAAVAGLQELKGRAGQCGGAAKAAAWSTMLAGTRRSTS